MNHKNSLKTGNITTRNKAQQNHVHIVWDILYGESGVYSPHFPMWTGALLLLRINLDVIMDKWSHAQYSEGGKLLIYIDHWSLRMDK